MHDKKNYMYMQGDDKETLAAQLAFAKAHGISEADFTGAWNSFTVQTSMQKADELVHRYHVDGVPLLVINGKYVTDVNMAGSHGQRDEHRQRPGCQRKAALNRRRSGPRSVNRP